MEDAFYNISMYLYNKNLLDKLDYAQIVQYGTESKIPHIESHSIIYA